MTEAAQRIHPCPSEASRFEADIPAVCVQNHAANLMPLPNGDIGCVCVDVHPKLTRLGV